MINWKIVIEINRFSVHLISFFFLPPFYTFLFRLSNFIGDLKRKINGLFQISVHHIKDVCIQFEDYITFDTAWPCATISSISARLQNAPWNILLWMDHLIRTRKGRIVKCNSSINTCSIERLSDLHIIIFFVVSNEHDH